MIQVCSGLRAGLALAMVLKQACRGQCLSEPAAAPRLLIEENSFIQP
jgi:hypothetical protein